jgi:transmembrane sensor
VTLGEQRGKSFSWPMGLPRQSPRRLEVVLKTFIALHHFLCAALDMSLRILRRTSGSGADEMPFALALTLELTFLSFEERAELEAYGTRSPTRHGNVVDISSYLPARPLRHRFIEQPPAPRAQRAPRWTWAPVCAVAALACLVIAPFLFATPELPSGEYLTGIGEHRTIPLADGSRIAMNTQTRLRVRYSPHGRDIELIEGEALFYVARDPLRPFRVHARRTIVEALGTRFSIYLGNSGTKIAVTQGRVKVFENLNPTPVILNPNGLLWTDTVMFDLSDSPEGLVVSAGHEARVSQDSFTDFEVETRRVELEELERRLAWVNGNLFFRGETLAEAVDEFNRYNWRKLKVTDPVIHDLQLGGEFETTDLDGFIEALERLYGIEVMSLGDPGSREPTIELRHRPTGPP